MRVQVGEVKSLSVLHGTAPRLKGSATGRSGTQTKGNAIAAMTATTAWKKGMEQLFTRDHSVPRGSQLANLDSLVPGLPLSALLVTFQEGHLIFLKNKLLTIQNILQVLQKHLVF